MALLITTVGVPLMPIEVLPGMPVVPYKPA